MKESNDDNIGKKLDLADSWLTKFGIILKKHWGKLLFILFCYCVWWAFNQPVEIKEPQRVEEAKYIAKPTDVVVQDSIK